MRRTPIRIVLRWTFGAFGTAAAVYGVLVATAWVRYGHPSRSEARASDPLLDRFMPAYDIVERRDWMQPAAVRCTGEAPDRYVTALVVADAGLRSDVAADDHQLAIGRDGW